MSMITLGTIVVMIIVAVIVLVALGLYLAGFRLTDLKVKLPALIEATLKREPGDNAASATAASPAPSGVEEVQEATGPGSLIKNSPQQASAAGVTQRQSASGGGRIEGSGQTAAAPADQQQRASNGGRIKNSSQRVE